MKREGKGEWDEVVCILRGFQSFLLIFISSFDDITIT